MQDYPKEFNNDGQQNQIRRPDINNLNRNYISNQRFNPDIEKFRNRKISKHKISNVLQRSGINQYRDSLDGQVKMKREMSI